MKNKIYFYIGDFAEVENHIREDCIYSTVRVPKGEILCMIDDLICDWDQLSKNHKYRLYSFAKNIVRYQEEDEEENI